MQEMVTMLDSGWNRFADWLERVNGSYEEAKKVLARFKWIQIG